MGPPRTGGVSGLVRLLPGEDWAFERGFPACGREGWRVPLRLYRPGARDAAVVQVCSGRFLAVTAVWMFGLLIPCPPIAALELREEPAWWEGNTPIVSRPGTSPAAAPAPPDGEGVVPRENGGAWRFSRGQQEVGLAVGYGFEIDAAGSSKSDMVKNLEFVLVRPRWGIFLTDRVGQGILEGNLELVLEPAFLLTTDPTRRTGFELSILFRYHFATGSRWVPFLTAGAGLIEENFKVTGRPSAGFNFTPQVGPGVSYLLDANMAISLEWRLYHVSNANIDTPNVGLNVGFFLLGISMFF